MSDSNGNVFSRRRLLTGGAAIAAAAALPKVPARAQAPARWRRYNVMSSAGQQMLVYYQNAIKAMLALPPSDPRNWYRLAFTHYLDCPHMNWWLFPWHRGFTGWAEQIVRRFSGSDQFAFPYWDWTAYPQVPASMFQGLLTPSNPAFIPTLGAFQSAFQPALGATTYWQGAQLQQLQQRGINSNSVLWTQITDPTNENFPVFFPASGGGSSYPRVRNPNPQLDCKAGPAVSPPVLKSAMAAQDYMTFSSGQSANHSQAAKTFGILENMSHNKVHNDTGGIVSGISQGQCVTQANVGGFMQAFLSPVDPLFYLHHSNIERLWTAWTAAQIAGGSTSYLPPKGPQYDQWASEPFLFFVDAAGNPVKQNRAGDYATVGGFSYDYQPGSVGAAVNGAKLLGGRRRLPVRRFVGETVPAAGMLGGAQGARVAVRLQPALLQLARTNAAQELIVKVEVPAPHLMRGQSLDILASTGASGPWVPVGSLTPFGHIMIDGNVVVTLPLTPTLTALRSRNQLRSGGALQFKAVVPAAGGALLGASAEQEVPVLSVVVEAH